MTDEKKSKTKPQRERFIETAKKLEVDESGEAFEKSFASIIQKKTPSRSQ